MERRYKLLACYLVAVSAGVLVGVALANRPTYWWRIRYQMISRPSAVAITGGARLREVVTRPSRGALSSPKAPYQNTAEQYLKKHDWLHLDALLIEWGRSDPIEAISWANELQPQYRRSAMCDILVGWTNSDPDNAIDWARRFEREVLSDERIYKTLVAEGRYDLGVLAVSSSESRFSSGRFLFSEWGRKDPGSALGYLQTLRTASYKDWFAGASGLLPELARSQPAEAISLVNSEAGSVSNRRSLYHDLASGLVASGQLDLAVQLMGSSSDETAFQGLAFAVADSLARSDPTQAAAWLMKISDPSVRNQNIRCILQIENTRPDLAVTIIEQDPNQAVRDVRLSYAINKWAQRDINGATEYAATTTALSDSARARLLAGLNTAVSN